MSWLAAILTVLLLGAGATSLVAFEVRQIRRARVFREVCEPSPKPRARKHRTHDDLTSCNGHA